MPALCRFQTASAHADQHHTVRSRCPCAQEYLPLGRFSEAEEAGFAALKAELRGSIQKGIDFVRKGS